MDKKTSGPLKGILIYSILFHITFGFSQGNSSYMAALSQPFSGISKHKSTLDPNRQNHLFTLGIKYQQTIAAKAFSSNGMYGTLGLNIARFFSKHLILGVFIDLKPINGYFYRQANSKSFVNDFNTNFNSDYSDSSGIVTANLLKENINLIEPCNSFLNRILFYFF